MHLFTIYYSSSNIHFPFCCCYFWLLHFWRVQHQLDSRPVLDFRDSCVCHVDSRTYIWRKKQQHLYSTAHFMYVSVVKLLLVFIISDSCIAFVCCAQLFKCSTEMDRIFARRCNWYVPQPYVGLYCEAYAYGRRKVCLTRMQDSSGRRERAAVQCEHGLQTHTHTHTRHVIRMLQNNNFNYFIRYEIIVNARAFVSGFVCNGKSHARGVYMQYFNLNFRMFLKRERERKRKRRERTRSNRLRSNTHTLTPEWNKRHSNNSNKIKKWKPKKLLWNA